MQTTACVGTLLQSDTRLPDAIRRECNGIFAKESPEIPGHELSHKDQFGYSFWLLVAALVIAAVDTVVARVTFFLGRHCL
ncbi:hypothetical protein KIN20_031461 [Parelaphostrongylus tenuis]|uniref:Uncharacterized protein n=1 Tax=Parelaphostrongylus tenuis TaxID=148309 RepID=A0AAD5WH99_PARTN|nr:hypothetical protein KIN20_031461 [Parelaphostrongylus tenuis]